ncbi:bifunctional adenosylcobinamide hydrolase/alpha-ribazole phosphatase CbiS [Pyrodictium occultum]|nr:bifunctional adenosylcobinamide hydrolase/alpha-ribazole phosphatase CbiS [Pyrodictium occultum]
MPAPGARLEGDTLVVELGGRYKVLSSISGLVSSEHIVFHHVPRGFSVRDVEAYRREVARSHGLPEETPVFLTAVEPGRHQVLSSGGVHVVATVGLEPPVCVEQERLYEPPMAGTINIAVIVEEQVLTPAGLVDLLRVAVEAKTLAASLLLLPCRGRASGTATDAVAVAARVDEKGLPWAGMATRLGNTVARLVREAVLRGDRRSLGERLRGALGLGPEELLEDMLRMYRRAPVPGVSLEEASRLLQEMLDRVLRDPNVWAFLVAARELDIHGVSGTLPGLSRGGFEADSRGIVADEALAAALALYLAGFRGLLAAYWVDRSKHEAGLRLASLPVFGDDAAAALAGALLARLYDRLLGTGV